MKVSVSYYAQVRQQAGVEQETIELPSGTSVDGALRAVDHGPGFRRLLFGEADVLHPVILPVVNGQPAKPDQTLQEGDQLGVFSPVAGG